MTAVVRSGSAAKAEHHQLSNKSGRPPELSHRPTRSGITTPRRADSGRFHALGSNRELRRFEPREELAALVFGKEHQNVRTVSPYPESSRPTPVLESGDARKETNWRENRLTGLILRFVFVFPPASKSVVGAILDGTRSVASPLGYPNDAILSRFQNSAKGFVFELFVGFLVDVRCLKFTTTQHFQKWELFLWYCACAYTYIPG